MKILVTGAKGQLGCEIKNTISQSIHSYLFAKKEELDITDMQALLNYITINKIDIIVNCAAYTDSEKAEDNFEKANLTNNIAIKELALICKEHNITLIHISSDYVLAGSRNSPYTEEYNPTKAINVYGITKLAGEKAIKETGCKSLIFRTSWLYSSYGVNFVKKMRCLLSQKDNLKVIFDQIGTPTYAKDLALLIYKVIEENLIEGKEGIYNFSNEGVCSWYDFAKEISDLSGYTCNIQPCHTEEFPSKVKRPYFSVLDKTKVKKTFNIEIPYWKDSLKKCIKEIENTK